MGEALALVELVQLSDVGRVRHHNEDRAFARGRLIAVADGMGGAKAGEVAAQMAVDAIAALPERASVDAVRDAVAEANRAIHGQASSDRDRAGMGTTFTGGLLRGAALNVLHVGDSRAYLWRDGRLIQITDDHSVVAELVRRGTLTEREAETHPHRNVITRALGAERTVQIDQISRSVRAGDVILLCSDGLSSYVSAAAIAGALADGDDLNAVARELVRLANDAGGVDNVTAVLARVGLADGPGVGGEEAEPPDTAEHPLMDTHAEHEPTSEMKVLGGVHGHAGTDRASVGPPPRARVLEPVPRRRGRALPIAVVVLALLVLGAGTLTWVASRSYLIEAGPGDTVRVAHGLPWTVLGVDMSREWQPIGVPAAAVRAADPGALTGSAHGQGDTVARAVELIWRYGLPTVPTMSAPATAPAPRSGARPGPATSKAGAPSSPPATPTGTSPTP